MQDVIRNGLRRVVEAAAANTNTTLVVVASLIGVLGGIGSVVFFELIRFCQQLSLGTSTDILAAVRDLPWYGKLGIPALGGLIVGPLVYNLSAETRGHGVPEVMEAVALRGGKIRSRVMFIKTFVSAVTIGTGGSVGREGPIVQIGSSVGSSIGQLLRMGPSTLKVLVASGAAAGIAATFNAPIAGVMFSIEIILGNYAITTLMPLIMASVMSTIVSHLYFGDMPAFEIPRYVLSSAWEIVPYVLLALLTGAVAVGFVRVLYAIEDAVERVAMPGWLKAPLFLLVVGGLITLFPELYGGGYETITRVLKGDMVWSMLAMLLVAKMLATSITLSAGGSGGVFAPSLFLGAVFGGLFGAGMHALFPAVVVTPGAYAVVGMSAMVAGTTHAPLTAFLVIFEMTGDYKLILPLMLCSILASFVASLLQKDSIYTMKLTRRGVDLSKGMEGSIMQATRVSDAMCGDIIAFNENTGFNDVLQKVVSSNATCYYVVNGDGTFQGTFTVHDVKEVMNEELLSGLVVAKDLASGTVTPHVAPQDTLAECMRKFSAFETEELPVLDSGSSRLLGKISRQDIINVYNHEILRQGTLGLKFIQGRLPDSGPSHRYVNLPEGFGISVIPVPPAMQDSTLMALDLRHAFGVTVVAVNRPGPGGQRTVGIPDPEESLRRGDMLVVVGRERDVTKFKAALSHPAVVRN